MVKFIYNGLMCKPSTDIEIKEYFIIMSNSEKSCDKLSFQIPPWHIQFRTVKLTFVQFGAASYDEKNNFILRKITEERIFYTWVHSAAERDC